MKSALKRTFKKYYIYISVFTFLLLCILIAWRSMHNSEIVNRPSNLIFRDLASKNSIYSIKFNTIEGKPFDTNSLKGKKVLIVNSASKCGNAVQYYELQELHEIYGDSLVILSFPCNDFGEQELENQNEIAQYCFLNYGVTFKICEKVNIKGSNQHEMYRWLTDPNKNGWNKEQPTWNFCKYLISEKGELLNYFGSTIKPKSKIILAAINT